MPPAATFREQTQGRRPGPVAGPAGPGTVPALSPRTTPAAAAHPASTAGLDDLAARFSLGWLVAANLVGVLLATLLLWPDLGDTLAPLTYGRWMPVHHNAQLYGWCALPLVGLLLRAFLVPGRAAARHARLAFAAWSVALGFGCVSWLRGEASGKLLALPVS